MTKPFGTLELVARIRMAMRHIRTTAENENDAGQTLEKETGTIEQ